MMGWGAAYVPSAWLVERWPPLVSAGARLGVAGVLLMAVAAMSGRGVRPGAGPWAIGWIALTQGVIFYGTVFWGIAHAGAGLSAVLSNTDPLFVAVLAAIFLGEHLRRRQWLGVVLGLVGAAVVAWDGPLWPPAISADAALVLGGAAAWGVGTIVATRRVRAAGAPIALAAWQMLLAGVVLAAVGLIGEGAPEPSAAAVGLVLLVAVIGGALPLALFYVALTRAPAGEVSAWFFLVPVVGVLSAWWLLGETPGVSLVVGMVTVSAGLYLVMAHRSRGGDGLVDSALAVRPSSKPADRR